MKCGNAYIGGVCGYVNVPCGYIGGDCCCICCNKIVFYFWLYWLCLFKMAMVVFMLIGIVFTFGFLVLMAVSLDWY